MNVLSILFLSHNTHHQDTLSLHTDLVSHPPAAPDPGRLGPGGGTGAAPRTGKDAKHATQEATIYATTALRDADRHPVVRWARANLWAGWAAGFVLPRWA